MFCRFHISPGNQLIGIDFEDRISIRSFSNLCSVWHISGNCCGTFNILHWYCVALVSPRILRICRHYNILRFFFSAFYIWFFYHRSAYRKIDNTDMKYRVLSFFYVYSWWNKGCLFDDNGEYKYKNRRREIKMELQRRQKKDEILGKYIELVRIIRALFTLLWRRRGKKKENKVTAVSRATSSKCSIIFLKSVSMPVCPLTDETK